jgi:hypothetical protein
MEADGFFETLVKITILHGDIAKKTFIPSFVGVL